MLVAPLLLSCGLVEPRRNLLLAVFLAAGVLWCAPARGQQSAFLYPPNGGVTVDATKPFSWTDVPGAEFYRLYVGTTLGGRDLIDTGAVHLTSRAMGGVPEGRALYARIWTGRSGAQLSSDVVFMVGAQSPLSVARLTYPSNDAVNADPTRPFAWAGVSGGQAYRLWVGTTPGSKNVLDTGPITRTSYTAAALPSRRTLYARIWTNLNGAWLYSEIRFTAAEAAAIPPARLPIQRAAAGPRRTSFLSPLPPLSPAPVAATFVYPANGAADVDPGKPIDWTDVSGAQTYRLTVGTISGGNDLVDSGEISQTSYPMAGLPSGPTLYATVWTKVNGAWAFSEIRFTAGPSSATFLYPTQGAAVIPDTAVTFQWTFVAAAQAYSLDVGRSPGAGDLIWTGPIQATSYQANGLPPGATIYARLGTQVAGQWLYQDIGFGTLPPASPIVIVYPQAGGGMDTGLPFEWSVGGQADAYRLQIGTFSGGSDLDDSGEIRVNRRFVRGLPLGPNLFGMVSAKVSGRWISRDFPFQVVGETASLAHRIDGALWATDFVRQMAAPNNIPFASTELYAVTGGGAAFCTGYAQALLNILVAMNTGLPSRYLNLCMNANFYDCHTLVEASPDGGATWMLLDPTFDITMKRASDGGWAQASDISTATRTFAWGAIDYVFLGAGGDAFLKGYYLDYPLLYLNVYEAGEQIVVGAGLSPLPYLQQVPFPVQNDPGIYVLRSESLPHVEISIDGLDTDVPFDGSDSLSHAFWAASIGPGPGVDPATLRAYVPLRFVF